MSNIVLNPGSLGATLGTDQVAGVDYQKIKVTFSTDGVAPVSADATHGLPTAVVAALPTGANTIGAVTQASGPWTQNLTQLLGTAVDVNSGAKSAGTLRVILATDQPSLTNALAVSQSGAPWSVSGSGTFTTADNHFPASAALSDALANPTTTLIGSNLLGWDATNTVWRRAQVTAGTGKLLTDGSSVTQPVSGTVTTTPPANASTNIAQIAGTATDSNSGNKSAGTIRVVLATDQPSLTNAQPVSQSGAPWSVTDVPATSGGWSKWSTPHDNSNAPLVATAGGVSIKASAGQLGGYIIYNPNASVAYVQVFDANAAITLGTTRPDVLIPIPPSSGANIEFGKGVAFASGIRVAATTTASGSTAPGTGLDCTFFFK